MFLDDGNFIRVYFHHQLLNKFTGVFCQPPLAPFKVRLLQSLAMHEQIVSQEPLVFLSRKRRVSLECSTKTWHIICVFVLLKDKPDLQPAQKRKKEKWVLVELQPAVEREIPSSLSSMECKWQHIIKAWYKETPSLLSTCSPRTWHQQKHPGHELVKLTFSIATELNSVDLSTSDFRQEAPCCFVEGLCVTL